MVSGDTAVEHDVCGVLPSRGRYLIEASAGTGKTYAIAALVTRLVAEEDVPIDQVLVVTFTRAAAAELRDRIRQRLVAAARALADPDDDDLDPLHRRLGEAQPDELQRRRGRIDAAVAAFDTATITTIHGFCQQVLKALGATSGHNPDAVLVQDTGALVRGVCADVIAAAALGPEPVPIGWDALVGTVGVVLGNPGVKVAAASGLAEDEVRRDLIVRAAEEVRDRLGSTGGLSFDGMLEAVRDALVGHPDAAARVAAQFPVALVDEFQDTDPVQWAILRSIYTDGVGGSGGSSAGGGGLRERPGTRLVLVGDPKQAIYAFRGGDVSTYLNAAAGATTATLSVNWRSDGGVLQVLNGLCDGWRLGDDRIRYRAVRAAAGNEHRRLLTRTGTLSPAVEVRCAARGLQMTEPTSKGKRNVPAPVAQRACIADVARCVVELLESGERIPCSADESEPGPPEVSGPPSRRVRPGDVAVLVHANTWSHKVQRALRRSGVPAIVVGASSVTDSPAGEQWRILIDALARPSDPTRARMVALSWFGDRDPGQVAASAGAADADGHLAELQDRLDRWAGLLRAEGVASLLAAVRVDAGLAASVLSMPDGERNLTDLEHIGELLHRGTSGRPVGPESLRALLDGMVAGGDEDDPEADRRRIDTDAPAVRIMTLHAAKGLEFPVVCCPSLWNLSRDRVTDRRMYHDGADRVLDVSASSKDVPAQNELALEEARGQDARLTYVGMTRAVHRLVLWWAAGPSAARSPVASLLFDDPGPSPDAVDHPAQIAARLAALGLDDVASLRDVPPPEMDPGRSAPRYDGAVESSVDRHRVPPAVAKLGHRIDRSAGRWSFTAITSLVHDEQDALVAGSTAWAGGGRDPDDPTLGDAADSDEQAPPPPVLFDGLGAGAAFGTLVHDVMEHLDFTGDVDGQLAGLLGARTWAGDAGRRARLVGALAAVVETPLGASFGELALSGVARSDRLNELDFEIPLATTPGRPTVDTRTVGRVLLAHLDPDDLLRGWARGVADGSIAVDIGGHLTGSVDLVLRSSAPVPGGYRYSVVDYKTNRLGNWAEPDGIDNYRRDRLADAMAQHHYPLQAVLYSVALHRFLRWRLDGYDPVQHLGPVGYLFVRGMVGAATPSVDGARHGVFAWTVPAGAVVELSDLLDGHPVGGSVGAT